MGSKGIKPGSVPSIIAKLYSVGCGRIAFVMLVPGMTMYC